MIYPDATAGMGTSPMDSAWAQVGANIGIPAAMLFWLAKDALPRMFEFFKNELSAERSRCDEQAALDRDMYRTSIQQLTRHLDEQFERLHQTTD